MKRRNHRRLHALIGATGIVALAAFPASAKEAADTDLVRTHSFSGAFLAARAAEADDDLSNAITYYQRALAYEPDNEALEKSLLIALVAEGRFDEALPHARALKSVPDIERFSRLALAVDDFRKDDYEGAEDWLELVLESDLDRLITDVMTAWAKAGDGATEEALAYLDGLEGPQWYGLFTNYHSALIAVQAGDQATAREAFEALANDPSAGSAAPDTYMRAMEAYATWLAGRGETDAALSVLDEAGNFITGRTATALLREGIEAGDDLPPVIARPADGAAEILLNVATALGRGGGEPVVKLYLNFAMALRPEDDDLLIQLASFSERQGEPEKAIGYYEQIGADSPWRRMAELQIGLNMADLDRHDEAIAFLEKALEKDPDDMRAYLALGRVHAARKDYREAANVYDRAVARLDEPQGEHWSLYYQRGIAYERLKEWPKAEPNFHEALDLYPDQPQVLNYLGYSWVDMNMNLEEGLELIRRAVELRPNDGYIVDSLGWAQYRLGNYEDAVEQLERAVQLRPDDPVLNDHLGDAYWRVGRRLEATFQWRHARDLDPEPDLLAEVEKKLEEGLSDAKPRKMAEAASEESGDGTMNDAANDAGEASQADEPSGEDGERGDDGAAAGDQVAPKNDAAPENEAADDGQGAPGEAAAKPAETAPEKNVPEGGADGGTYVIKAGETLWSIAAEQLGDGERFREILTINPALRRNPDLLRAGQQIRLPD